MKPYIENIRPNNITENWLLNYITLEFKNVDENITAFRILSKLGVAIHNEPEQLKYKTIIKKLKDTLKTLNKMGALELKNSTHDTLGVKEKAYKLRDATKTESREETN